MKRLTDEEIIKRVEETIPTLHNVKKMSDGNFTAYCELCGGYPVMSRFTAINIAKRWTKCPICHGLQVVEGINDIKSQFPDIAAYFVDDEFVRTHSIGTKEKGLTRCPDCGGTKLIQPHKIRSRGYSCNYCSDGVSYPNKFARQVLSQLPIKNFIPEYLPKWINRLYDNYFEYNEEKYILEMDGRQHFEDTEWSTYDQQVLNDRYKDEAATSHGIRVIRVNCYYTDFEYIKNSIINSELGNIFDLSIIDWDRCNRNSIHSLVFETSKYFNENPDISIQAISEYFKIDRHTLTTYLKRGTELGLCSYSISDSRRRATISCTLTHKEKCKRPIYVYDRNNNYIGFFEYASDCANYLNEKYKDVNFDKELIHRTLNGLMKSYRGFYFYKDRKEKTSDRRSSICVM